MIQVSNAYKELVKSNIRPKCEPIVKVSGIDNTGKEIELVWNAKNIKDLNYKRSIDPVGRELPYMELTWTEIYTGKLNAESYPEKYNNIVKYMQVELSFVQDLAFYNTWKTLFDGGIKWKELFSKTWKQVKNEISQEVITMPKMFLSARPTVEGKTIKWVAKDVLFFLDEKIIKAFYGKKLNGMPFKNPLAYLLQNARGGFLQSNDLFLTLTSCIDNIIDKIDANDILDEDIIFDGATKDCIKNYANLRNFFWDFSENIPILKNEYEDTDYSFTKKTMYNHPTITSGTNISSYSFKNRLLQVDENSPYTKKSSKINLGNNNYNLECDIWYYDGYGTRYVGEDYDGAEEINYAISASKSEELRDLTIYPVNYNEYDNILNNQIIGELFVENNPVNPYGASSSYMVQRFELLKEYFNENCSILEFETLPNISIETGDIISVVTNLFDENGELVIKNAVVISFEIIYNGALKQKIIAHEVMMK